VHNQSDTCIYFESRDEKCNAEKIAQTGVTRFSDQERQYGLHVQNVQIKMTGQILYTMKELDRLDM